MSETHDVLVTLMPVIALLALGVVAVLGSRSLRLSPIVGYLVLGLVIRATGVTQVTESPIVHIMAQLGVVFLLFDIGLHFSLSHIRLQARDIFGLGPAQVVYGVAGLSLAALALGLAPTAALLTGAVLALSSTAVDARLIADRRQQDCPVGLTATAILIFQDVAAIFLLIIAVALGSGEALAPALALALVKAGAAFVIAVLLARIVVKPLFDIVARGRNEEVFTAMALLIALAAGWATGVAGLSLTLGAFLGGMIVAETPYRALIRTEIKPFRGLLLGFFFISVGLSLDLGALARLWPAVLAVTMLLMAIKIVTNALASLTFRWSVPGSVQLGFLLAQGSEFAFVILGLPSVRALLGEKACTVLIASVALSLAVTPSLARFGRNLAGRLRAHAGAGSAHGELIAQRTTTPVYIAGMGQIGRTVADALTAFDFDYLSIERDDQRLREAVADGYKTAFGDFADPRIWESISLHGQAVTLLTAPSFDIANELLPLVVSRFPDLRRIAVARDEALAKKFQALGFATVIDRSSPRGLDVAACVLDALGVEQERVAVWRRQRQERALARVQIDVAAAL